MTTLIEIDPDEFEINPDHIKIAVNESEQRAATIAAAEELIVWLKETDDYNEQDASSLLADVMMKAGFRSLQLVATFVPGEAFFTYDLVEKAQASGNTA
jgi:hypothetical protein